MKQTITLDVHDVREAIAEYINRSYDSNITVDKVKFDLGIDYVGHQMNEHKEAVFKGASVELTK